MKSIALIAFAVLSLGFTRENAFAQTNCRPGSHYVVGHYINIGPPPQHRRWIAGACKPNTTSVHKGGPAKPASPKG